MVRCLNEKGSPSAYGEASLEGYYSKLANAYSHLVGNRSPTLLTVDCANGVGTQAMEALVKVMSLAQFKAALTNTQVDNVKQLNQDCGADYVKLKQSAPLGNSMTALGKYASLDGDADRIVYYFTSDVFHLLDGDKIALLATEFLMELVAKSKADLSVGLVQTAYANGSSTAYAKNVLVCLYLCHIIESARSLHPNGRQALAPCSA